MTGSGKSELIMTMILSLAVNYHPYDVAFILIDFKGGGMAKAFEKLPHTVGIITNLDGNEIKRSLASINSELRKRQMSINEAFTNRAAACFLMPLFLVLRVLKKYNGGNKIVAYDGYVMAQDQKIIVQKMADAMGVNYSPLFTRLKELNLIDLHPIDEYLTSFNRGGVMPS